MQMSSQELQHAQQLNYKLLFYKQFQTQKFVFSAWKRHYASKQKRMRRLERIVLFFEKNQEHLIDRVFNGWRQLSTKQHLRQLQIPRRVNMLESMMLEHARDSQLIMFQQFKQLMYDRKLLISIAERVRVKQAGKTTKSIKFILCSIHSQQQLREKFCFKYYSLQVQKRYFEEWSSSTRLQREAKKLRYFAFEGARRGLQLKSFEALNQHCIRKKTNRSNFNLINDFRQQKLKVKYLFTWIKICVQAYQSEHFQQTSLLQKAFQVMKLWTSWTIANRHSTSQALIYAEYQTMKTVFSAWKLRSAIKSEKHAVASELRDLLLHRHFINLVRSWRQVTELGQAGRNIESRAVEHHTQATLRSVFQGWCGSVELKQTKYLKNFNSSATYKIILKRRLFTMWMQFLRRKHQQQLHYETIKAEQHNAIIHEILGVMVAQVNVTMQKLVRAEQFRNSKLSRRALKSMATRCGKQRQKLQHIEMVDMWRFGTRMIPLFNWWRVYVSQHRSHKRRYALTHYHLGVQVKAFKALRQFGCLRRLTTQIQSNHLNLLMKQTFSEMVLSLKISKMKAKSTTRLAKQIFQHLCSHKNKQQYNGCCVDYMEVRRSKVLMQSAMQQLKLHKSYEDSKRLVQMNLLRLHYVKFMRRHFLALKAQVRRRKMQDSKALDVVYLKQFRLKKSFFKAAMLLIIGD